ncbi:esterase-like activity of phytase family protein [Thioclava sp. BHET1]|nr:esterase-like activity of phytase family protein [Thioclava sp. BHET1]
MRRDARARGRDQTARQPGPAEPAVDRRHPLRRHFRAGLQPRHPDLCRDLRRQIRNGSRPVLHSGHGSDGQGLHRALFPVSGTDSESIRFAPGGGLVWSSERDQKNAPHVYTATADGKETGTYPVPAYYAPNADMTQGAYPNVSFEGISFTPNRAQLIVSTENGLMQDGPKATLKQGSPSRFLAFDAKSHKLLWERIYMTDPIPHAPAKEGGHADNGISEILALGPDRYLVMERSWSQGVGDDIRLYLATTEGATEVTGQAHVELSQVKPMTKTLLLTLDPKSVGLQWIDNIECMTFGPRVDGHRTLILASDNNFSDDEQTQFIAYELPDSLN